VHHLVSEPKPSIPNLLPAGRLWRKRMTASLVISILLYIPMEPDLSMRKINCYLESKSFGRSYSSREPVENLMLLDLISSEDVNVGRKDAITAT
jgi:hypothetical protein